MSWHPNNIAKLPIVAGALLLALGASAASADVLVVRATGPSAKAFPAGKSLADNAKIALKPNDTLVLLDAKGTRTLRGPGNFTPSSASAAGGTTVLASNTTPQRRARIGAVRSVGMSEQKPSMWNLDTSKSSNFCLANAADFALWRADASKPAVLTLTRVKDGRASDVAFAAGQTVTRWPSELAISDGADYRLSWKNAKPTVVKFKTLASVPNSVNDMAASLIKHGCSDQLDLLIASVPDSNSVPVG